MVLEAGSRVEARLRQSVSLGLCFRRVRCGVVFARRTWSRSRAERASFNVPPDESTLSDERRLALEDFHWETIQADLSAATLETEGNATPLRDAAVRTISGLP